MKIDTKQFTLVLILLTAYLLQINAQENTTDYYYYHEGEPIYLTLSTEAIVVKFDASISLQKQQTILNAASISDFEKIERTVVENIYYVHLKQPILEENIADKIDNLGKQAGVLFSAPVLKPHKGSPVSQLVTDQFIVQYVDDISKERMQEINSHEQAEIIKDLKRNTYVLRIKPLSKNNGLEAANRYVENYGGEVIYAEPDFIYKGLYKAIVNDPLHENQWAHENTGQEQDTDGGQGDYGFPTTVSGSTDADMDVELAWDISTGSGILIGIIDSGVDLDHPDLQDNILNSGWDAIDGDSVANDDDSPYTEGGHGTAVAGIAAASGNNGLGVAGIAYDAQILPIRIFTVLGYTSNSAITAGIDTAWMWGADVLCNSWGGGTPSTTVGSAITRAKTEGRNGKGCVILLASGNADYHEEPDYPARHSGAIAIGATNMFDEKKNPGSSDGQFWWGGNYGSGLDICAPTINYTTDIASELGYDETGDYFSKFNGTSASTPNAAGVAALVLSVNPNLTSDEVQDIMERSADKIDLYPYYTNAENGVYNARLGYGRVNAHAAVQLTLGNDYIPPSIVFTPLPHITGSDDQTLSVAISDESGIGTGTDQPVLYYQTDNGSGFGPWISITDVDGSSGDVYEFIIPGQSNGCHVQYYVAAKDASSQGNTGSFPFGASDGSAVGDNPPPRTFSYYASHVSEFMVSSVDIPVTISSGSPNTVTSIIMVDSSFSILDVNVTLAINHTYDRDLIINLTSPSGTCVNLIGSLGEEYNNFFITTLDDESTELIINGYAPFDGTYQPKYPLSEFDGENAQGTWQLTIYDQYQYDGGALLSWSLSFLKPSPFTAPRNLLATPGDQQVTLTWNPVEDSEVYKYSIYRGLSSLAITLIDSVVSPTPPDTFYLDNSVSNEQEYFYRVTAVSNSGIESDFSNEVHIVPGRFIHYVDVNNGDDITGEGTKNSPWKTISYALTQILWPGHSIFMAKGIYDTDAGEIFPISMVNGVSLVGSGVDSSIIDAGGSSTVLMCQGIADSSTLIKGFTIKNGGGTYFGGGGGLYIVDGSTLKIINNKITENIVEGSDGSGGGIYINNSSVWLENNEIINNRARYGSGIYLLNGSATIIGNIIRNHAGWVDGYYILSRHVFINNSSALLKENLIMADESNLHTGTGVDVLRGYARIVNNIISGHSSEGIDITLANATILNNTISNNDGNGISVTSSLVDSVVNNIISYNSGSGISEVLTSYDPGIVSYNLFHENSRGVYRDEGQIIYSTVDSLNMFVPEASYNIAGDPLFVESDSLNFHLLPSSPAIDAGDPNLPFDNEPRPNGCRINIGAYGNTAEATMSVPFILQGPIADVIYPEDSGPHTVADLEDVFSMCPGFPLDFNISSDNPEIHAIIANSLIQINSTPDFFGTGTVIITASDETDFTLSDTFSVDIFSVNDPPEIDNLSDIEFLEDSSYVFDLDTMVIDVDHDTTEISWSVSFLDNILETISNQMLIKPDSRSQKNIIVKTESEINSNKSISNLSLNSPTIITRDEDKSSANFSKSLSKIIEPTNSFSNLNTINNIKIGIILGIIDSLMINIDSLTHITTITATPNFYGLDIPVTFTATDDSGASDTDTTTISVLPINDPHFILPLLELTFNEDDTFKYAIKNWFPFIDDPDQNPAELSYLVFPGVNIAVDQRDDTCRFYAPENWYGRDILQLIVSDSVFSDTADFYINVNSINDPPVISNLPESITFATDSSASLNIWEYVEDVETPDSMLNYTFSPSNDSLQEEFDSSTGNLSLSALSGFAGEAFLHITVKDDSGAISEAQITIIVSPITGLNYPFTGIPKEFVLMQNYPNPFNPITHIRYGLPIAGHVKIEIYNIVGQRVVVLVDKQKSAGYHVVQFDSKDFATGFYFYHIKTKNFHAVKKMILVK